MSITTSTNDASPSERDGSELCLQCGLCCNGALFSRVDLVEDELPLARAANLDIFKHCHRPAFRQPCAAFQGQRCHIYEHRPTICRSYRCKLLTGYLRDDINLEQAAVTVDETIAAIGAIVERIGMPDATQRVWRQVGAWAISPESLPSEAARQTNRVILTNVAILAALLYNHFVTGVPAAMVMAAIVAVATLLRKVLD
jgi:uncharacterized protein